MQFGTVALSIGAIVLLALPGFLLSKFKMIGTGAIAPLTTILLYVTSPLLTFNSFQESSYSPELMTNLLWMSLICLALYVVASVITVIFVRPKVAPLNRRVSGFMSMFPNGGFMGIPLLQSLYPGNPEPIIYAAIGVAFFNLFVWTAGGYIMTGDKKFVSAKNALLNPATIALAVSVPLFVLGLKINDAVPPLHSALKMLGNCTTPIAMTILGIRLSSVPLKRIFADGKVYAVSALKLVAMPLLTLLLLTVFTQAAPLSKDVAFIVSAMPSATTGVVFAEKYLGDGSAATACFVNSTLFSILTVPLLAMVFL